MMKYSTPLTNHNYASARVNHFEDGTVQLQSYSTIVIEITGEGWLRCSGTYSATTIKHIGWFMRERGLSYQLAKGLFLTGKEYNVRTGEVRDLT